MLLSGTSMHVLSAEPRLCKPTHGRRGSRRPRVSVRVVRKQAEGIPGGERERTKHAKTSRLQARNTARKNASRRHAGTVKAVFNYNTEQSAEGGSDLPQARKSSWPYQVGLLILALSLAVWKIPALNALAGKSGFTAAFSLVFVSEIGDKTFFLAALLAAQKSRILVLVGSMAALSMMTVISVGIGYCLQQLPGYLNSSIPVTEYLSIALIFLFGMQSLRDAMASGAKDSNMLEEELEDAKETLQSSEDVQSSNVWKVVLSTFLIIFAAEWGDRSMFATVALVASQNPIGVAVGGITGHLAATLIAIVGGAVVSKYLSERVIKFVGGSMFMLIGIASLVGVF